MRATGILLSALVATGLASAQQSGRAEQVLQISGTYDAARHSPETGRLYRETQVLAEFVAVLGPNYWRIRAHDLRHPGSWSELAYDGTNLLTRTAYAGHFVRERPEKDLAFATLSNSQLYCPFEEDFVYIYVPWLTYAFSPRSVATNAQGIVHLPMPWSHPRNSLSAYGFAWNLTPSKDGRFVSRCQVVRDQSLDLDDAAEFARPELSCPETASDEAIYRGSLRSRRGIKSGFVRATYTCSEWQVTNNVSIPVASAFAYYREDGWLPMIQAELKATNVVVLGRDRESLPAPDGPTLVNDYRYRKTSSGGKRLECAEYMLQRGEAWKPINDPALLANTNQCLRYGKVVGDPPTKPRKREN